MAWHRVWWHCNCGVSRFADEEQNSLFFVIPRFYSTFHNFHLLVTKIDVRGENERRVAGKLAKWMWLFRHIADSTRHGRLGRQLSWNRIQERIGSCEQNRDNESGNSNLGAATADWATKRHLVMLLLRLIFRVDYNSGCIRNDQDWLVEGSSVLTIKSGL